MGALEVGQCESCKLGVWDSRWLDERAFIAILGSNARMPVSLFVQARLNIVSPLGARVRRTANV